MTAGRYVCPQCGSGDELGTMERLLGRSIVDVVEVRGDSDDPAIDYMGETDVHWDTSETYGWECHCGWYSDASADPTKVLRFVPDEEIEA